MADSFQHNDRVLANGKHGRICGHTNFKNAKGQVVVKGYLVEHDDGRKVVYLAKQLKHVTTH